VAVITGRAEYMAPVFFVAAFTASLLFYVFLACAVFLKALDLSRSRLMTLLERLEASDNLFKSVGILTFCLAGAGEGRGGNRIGVRANEVRPSLYTIEAVLFRAKLCANIEQLKTAHATILFGRVAPTREACQARSWRGRQHKAGRGPFARSTPPLVRSLFSFETDRYYMRAIFYLICPKRFKVLDFVTALLWRNRNEAAMPLHESGRQFYADVVVLSGLEIGVNASLLVIRAENMFARSKFCHNKLAIVHTRKLIFVTVHGGREGASYKLLVTIDVHRGLGLFVLNCSSFLHLDCGGFWLLCMCQGSQKG
jgi:hypothetical protein